MASALPEALARKARKRCVRQRTDRLSSWTQTLRMGPPLHRAFRVARARLDRWQQQRRQQQVLSARNSSKLISRVLAGALLAAVAAAAMYALAATAASAVTASFSNRESATHSQRQAFASALELAWREHRAARAKCELLVGTHKNICNAEGRAREKRALGRL